MIKAVFKVNEDSGEITLSVKGHAGAGGVGYDIICASATILAYTLAQNVTTMNEVGRLKEEPKVKLKEGEILVSCIPTAEAFEEVFHAYIVILGGYMLLAKNYKQYVRCRPFKVG